MKNLRPIELRDAHPGICVGAMLIYALDVFLTSLTEA